MFKSIKSIQLNIWELKKKNRSNTINKNKNYIKNLNDKIFKSIKQYKTKNKDKYFNNYNNNYCKLFNKFDYNCFNNNRIKEKNNFKTRENFFKIQNKNSNFLNKFKHQSVSLNPEILKTNFNKKLVVSFKNGFFSKTKNDEFSTYKKFIK